ncbi:MAG: hypothetical protein ACKO24_07290 [Leptolyngbyaceae cyanobacterium]
MSAQNHPIPSLIGEIDRSLQQSTLSWQTVEALAQQRQLLERVRQVLSQLSAQNWENLAIKGAMLPQTEGAGVSVASPSVSVPTPDLDSIAMMRAVVQEVEQLRTGLVQPLHTELAYLRQQREQLLQEIRQLELQRQSQLSPTSATPQPLDAAPSITGLAAAALSQSPPKESASSSDLDQCQSSDSAAAMFPYAGVEVQQPSLSTPSETGQQPQDLIAPLSASLERDINDWWAATSGMATLTGTELELLDAELDLQELDLDDADLAVIRDLQEIDAYLERHDNLQQRNLPHQVENQHGMSSSPPPQPTTERLMGGATAETGHQPREIQTPLATANQPDAKLPDAELMVQQIRTLTDLLPEQKPGLATDSTIFSWDEAMGALFNETPEVMTVKPAAPPASAPLPDDFEHKDIRALFVDTPPMATPAPPPCFNTEPVSSESFPII